VAEAGRKHRDRLALIGADLERERAAEDPGAIELGVAQDALDLLGDLLHLSGDGVAVVVVVGAVVELHLQITHALQHGVHLTEGPFSRLDERDAVLSVALRLRQTTDLTTHLLRDAEASGVVGRAVDAIAAGELLHRLRSGRRRSREGTVSVERLDVVPDTKAHVLTLLV